MTTNSKSKDPIYQLTPAYAEAIRQAQGAAKMENEVITIKHSIAAALYYLRLGETGRATEILNQALSD